MNNKPIRAEYNIQVLAETFGYVFQFEPYQGVKKGKQVDSSTKCRNSYRRCSVRKPIFRNSKVCNFIKKQTLAQVFSCESCEISRNTFFTKHLLATASVNGVRKEHCFATDEMLTLNSYSYHIFMDNYFTSFRLLTHLGVYLSVFNPNPGNNIRVTGGLNKNMLRKCTIIGGKQLQKQKKTLPL